MSIPRRDLLLGTAALALSGDARSRAADAAGERYPPAASDLFLQAPVSRWDEGLPLGNGLIGAVLYGEDRVLRLALDRGDLWDLRLPEVDPGDGYNRANLLKLKAEDDERAVQRAFVRPFETALYPAKLPAGYLMIGLRDGTHAARAFHLDLARAEARVDIGASQPLTAFAAAHLFPGLVFLRIPGAPPDLQIVRPYSFDKRGYPAATAGIDGRVFWLAQKGPDGSGLDYAIVASSRVSGAETQIVVTVIRTTDVGAEADPVAAGRARIAAVLSAGYDAALKPHLAWWRTFWGGSRLGLPDDHIQSLCDRTRYFYGASSRLGAPPIAGQGIWTEDMLTPATQATAYRHDLALPAAYLPYATLGLSAVGDAFCDAYAAKLPGFIALARSFYDIEATYSPPAAVIPENMTGDGRPIIGGWPADSLSTTSGAWVALLFLRHARFGYGGASFLGSRAYSFAAAVGNGFAALLESDGHMRGRLPLSSSPELVGDRLAAYVTPNSNWDLTLMRSLFNGLAASAKALGKSDETARWELAASSLEPLHQDTSGALLIAEGKPYAKSAPHLGHAAAIYPFGLLTVEGSVEDRQTITATLADFKRVGTQLWEGQTFAWYAAMLARCGLAERAMIGLDDYARGFVSRNGFHIGGDQSGKGFTYRTDRVFSLQGNFLALEAVYEMLLQSWGGTVRVFPAVTQNWPDVSFAGLHTEVGLRVSAMRKSGRTARVHLEATRDGTFRLRNPFGGATPHWSRLGVRRTGGDHVVALRRGETLEGHV